MSQANVEIVRQAFESLRSGLSAETIEESLALTDPNCELTSRLASVEGVTYRGHEGLRAYRADLDDAFQEWHNELHEIAALGTDAVLTESTFRATGKSGVDVDLRSATVWLFSAGLIVEVRSYPGRHEALEAAGHSTS